MSGPDLPALRATLDFVLETERLKDTLRSGITAGGRQESTAEHTWRLCLMIMLFHRHVGDADLTHMLKLALVHDLGEIDHGDVPAIHQSVDDDRKGLERTCMERLAGFLDATDGEMVLALHAEYDAGITREARLVRAFDKLETVIQHTQGANAAGFDYHFNLGYGRQWTDSDPVTAALKEIADAATLRRAEGADAWP